MSFAPARVCNEPGCPRLTTGRDAYCAQHGRTSSRNHYGVSRHARGLDAEYLRMREIVLAEEPICYACSALSVTADHVRSRQFGGTSARANLRGSCTRHNYGRRDDG